MQAAAAYSSSLSDPGAPGVIAVAAYWVQGVMLGSAATAIAVIAVAAVGLGMLTGRVNWRRGARVVIGCFLIFGAAGLAAALRGLGDEPLDATVGTADVSPLPPPPPAQASAPTYDPYAGAAPDR